MLASGTKHADYNTIVCTHPLSEQRWMTYGQLNDKGTLTISIQLGVVWSISDIVTPEDLQIVSAPSCSPSDNGIRDGKQKKQADKRPKEPKPQRLGERYEWCDEPRPGRFPIR